MRNILTFDEAGCIISPQSQMCFVQVVIRPAIIKLVCTYVMGIYNNKRLQLMELLLPR